MKILCLGYDYLEGKTGAKLFSSNIMKLLEKLYGRENLREIRVERETGFWSIIGKNLLLETVNSGDTAKAMEAIGREGITHLFLDMSYFGALARRVRKNFPELKIITLFHNVEIKYAWERVRVEGYTRMIALPRVYYQEKLAVKYSHTCIVLNERDMKDLERIYRGKGEIVPLFLEDRYVKPAEKETESESKEKYLLFVGSAFFANLEGINWFIRKVLPEVEGYRLKIVGKGMECLKEKYRNIPKLEIIGEVTEKELEEYYKGASALIAPIFSGSGMKTKSIEALMFGKILIGTGEALTGIEGGWRAETPKEFLEKIAALGEGNFSSENRKIYLDNYSPDAVGKKMKKIIGENL